MTTKGAKPSQAKRIALFTGAGASKAIGYPLTKELLPRVRTEIQTGELFEDTNDPERDGADRAELSGYLSRLLPGFRKLGDDQLPLITDVFSLVEYALFSGDALPIGGEESLRRCRDLLKHAITDILMGDFQAPWDESNAEQREQRTVSKRFAHWVHRQADTLGLVTTNYDIGLENEVYRLIGRARIHEAIDLGLDWREVRGSRVRVRPVDPALRVYKLHGSLDQLRCPLCGHIYFNEQGNIAFQTFRTETDRDNTCVCGDDIRLQLHIVAPSFVRDTRESNLLSVWRSALEWMRTADRWVIVGYSLPPEDLAIRSMLLRAYAGRKKKPKIDVVQYGRADEPRYRLLFPDCNYRPDGLKEFLAGEE